MLKKDLLHAKNNKIKKIQCNPNIHPSNTTDQSQKFLNTNKNTQSTSKQSKNITKSLSNNLQENSINSKNPILESKKKINIESEKKYEYIFENDIQQKFDNEYKTKGIINESKLRLSRIKENFRKQIVKEIEFLENKKKNGNLTSLEERILLQNKSFNTAFDILIQNKSKENKNSETAEITGFLDKNKEIQEQFENNPEAQDFLNNFDASLKATKHKPYEKNLKPLYDFQENFESDESNSLQNFDSNGEKFYNSLKITDPKSKNLLKKRFKFMIENFRLGETNKNMNGKTGKRSKIFLAIMKKPQYFYSKKLQKNFTR